ncbi:MAG: exodeoxyribonuclease VII small subunit [Paludibacteraceae bacterium]|nr:exodeoxyribonuclease VII small subunit [Paludibacteraceae bacterium]
MKKEMSYKAAMVELKEILELLESGQADMDELTKKAKRAKELLQFCKEKLYHTSEEVESLIDK